MISGRACQVRKAITAASASMGRPGQMSTSFRAMMCSAASSDSAPKSAPSESGASGSPKPRGKQPLVWSPDVLEPLENMSGLTAKVLEDLRALRPRSKLWQLAFDSVGEIAASPVRHLLRPQLVLLGHAAGTGSPSGPGVTHFTAGVELHHLFMLIHDDIMDRGTTRRGKPTLSVTLARSASGIDRTSVANLATVIGDLLHAKSVGMMLDGVARRALNEGSKGEGQPRQERVARAVEAILESSYMAGASQFEDISGWRCVESEVESSSDAKQFLSRMLCDKGARHGVVAPLIAGMRLGGADSSLEAGVEAWGLRFGSALQGLDDLQDITADPMTTGKDTMQDLRQGRLSLPLFMLHEHASQQDWRAIRAVLLAGDGVISIPDRRMVFEVAKRTNLVQRCVDFIQQEIHGSTEAVKGLPEPLGSVLLMLSKELDARVQKETRSLKM